MTETKPTDTDHPEIAAAITDPPQAAAMAPGAEPGDGTAGEPPADTAGHGNTGRRAPEVEGGQPAVGGDDAANRNTEF